MFKARSNHQLEDDSQQDNKVSKLKCALGPLSGHSLVFCSDASLRRYLDARSWNVENAKQMIEETLKWRSTYKPHEIPWHEVAHEGETGKVSRASFHDRQGRTVLIVRPGLQAVKYFLDPRTAQKVNFVYPKDKASDELMRSHFDMENLPKEFGGEATLEYDHEEFSRQMFEEDLKTAKFCGLEEKQYPQSNGFSPADVVPEPAKSLA